MIIINWKDVVLAGILAFCLLALGFIWVYEKIRDWIQEKREGK